MGSHFRAAVGQLGSGWRPPPAAACARTTAAGSGAHSLISPVAGAPTAPNSRPIRFPGATVARMWTGCRRFDRYRLLRYGVCMSYINARACNQSCVLISYRYGSDFWLIPSHPGRLGSKTRTSTPRLKRPKRLKRLKRSSVDMILLLPNHLYGCADGCAKRFLMA